MWQKMTDFILFSLIIFYFKNMTFIYKNELKYRPLIFYKNQCFIKKLLKYQIQNMIIFMNNYIDMHYFVICLKMLLNT